MRKYIAFVRILLIGEYSRLHNSLKEGLQNLGHNVVIMGTRDGFKKYPVDLEIQIRFSKGIGGFIRKILYKIFKYDLKSKATQIQFNQLKEQCKGYDVVQFINERSLQTIPKIERTFFNYIFENNKAVYLLSCGYDYPSVKFAYDQKLRYSILSPFFQNRKLKKMFNPVLQYLEPEHLDLHHYIYKNIRGVIASDIDYQIPLMDHPKFLGLMPNPINIVKLKYIKPVITDQIFIFHGVNKKSSIKKGTIFFDIALERISRKYDDKVKIIRTEDIPYHTYIELYNKCHILLDQVYAYDQGYNALEAMAKGKVVFTGAEQEWVDYYKLAENTVAINALPDVDDIVTKLSWLIENPKKIVEISKNARAFIEREHDYVAIAERYLEVWKI